MIVRIVALSSLNLQKHATCEHSTVRKSCPHEMPFPTPAPPPTVGTYTIHSNIQENESFHALNHAVLSYFLNSKWKGLMEKMFCTSTYEGTR